MDRYKKVNIETKKNINIYKKSYIIEIYPYRKIKKKKKRLIFFFFINKKIYFWKISLSFKNKRIYIYFFKKFYLKSCVTFIYGIPKRPPSNTKLCLRGNMSNYE
jgi:hypothetical protein